MSEAPQGPGWWQASDGRWYPPHLHPAAQQAAPQMQPVVVQSAPQKNGFVQGLGVGTGCLIAFAISMVVLLGGCGVLLAIGAANSDVSSSRASAPSSGSSPRSGGSSGVDRGFGSKDASADLVSVSKEAPDAIGIVYVSVTVKNNSEKTSNYYIEISFESEDGSVKYGDTVVYIRNVAPGQTTTDKALAGSEIADATKYRVTKLQRTAS